jgi:hypothetical protein
MNLSLGPETKRKHNQDELVSAFSSSQPHLFHRRLFLAIVFIMQMESGANYKLLKTHAIFFFSLIRFKSSFLFLKFSKIQR